ncbi:MAG: biotin transporter BioY [Gemmatimonadota bacterium]|nr:biotin transporter BioY [Gemmatimonadota bacterium]
MQSLSSPAVASPRLAAFDRPAERVAGILAFTLLTALGAFVRIPLPFTPVPVTLQTFFVLTAGLYLGGRDAAISQLGYLGLGAAGLPVFAGGAGVAHLLGATGGYLLAFPVVAWLVGATVRPGDGAGRATAVFAAATLTIFGCGAAWLARVAGLDLAAALALGVLPFLPGAALKIAAAVALAVRAPLSR